MITSDSHKLSLFFQENNLTKTIMNKLAYLYLAFAPSIALANTNNASVTESNPANNSLLVQENPSSDNQNNTQDSEDLIKQNDKPVENNSNNELKPDNLEDKKDNVSSDENPNKDISEDKKEESSTLDPDAYVPFIKKESPILYL